MFVPPTFRSWENILRKRPHTLREIFVVSDAENTAMEEGIYFSSVIT